MGLSETIFGTPPSTNVQFAPGFRAPGFNFARDLGNYLKTLIGTPAPSYQGALDPGMSPTMQMLGRMTQQYSTSPAPQIMGQVAGTLGRYMNPTFGNPLEQLQRGITNPFRPSGVEGASPGGRPGVMPGSNPAGGFGSAFAGGGGAGGDGGAPTLDLANLQFGPMTPIPTDARPMFGAIDGPPPPSMGGGRGYEGGPMPSGGGYQGGPFPAGGGGPFTRPDPRQLPPDRFGPLGRPPGGRVPPRRPPKPGDRPRGIAVQPPTTSREDPRLAEIRDRVGALPRRRGGGGGGGAPRGGA